MQIKTTFLLSMGLLLVSLPVIAGPPAEKGVTRTLIEGSDNWGWDGGPLSPATIICPGGELIPGSFDCSDSNADRLHLRDGRAWSCMTTNDERMTGVGLFTSNGNFDAGSNGSVWGEWKIVPMAGCDKNAVYKDAYEDFVNFAPSFWHGTWNGQRQFDSDQKAWIGELKIVGKGWGDLAGLHFKGTEWITTYTPFPVPYEFLFKPSDDPAAPFNAPEGEFTGTIKE